MKKSNAISPEMRGVFERIEKQAEEYEKAFDKLDKFYRDVDRIKRENEELIIRNSDFLKKNSELYKRLESIENYISLRIKRIYDEVMNFIEINVIEKNNSKLKEVIDEFQIRADKAINLLEGDSGVEEFLQKLKDFLNIMENKFAEVQNTNNKIEETNEEIAETKKEIEYFKLDLEELTKKLNEKIAANLKNSQQEFKAALDSSAFSAEERVKNIIFDVKNMQNQINKKSLQTDEKIKNFIKISKKLEEYLTGFKQSAQEANRQVIERLKARVEEIGAELRNEIKEIQQKNPFFSQKDGEKSYKVVEITNENN